MSDPSPQGHGPEGPTAAPGQWAPPQPQSDWQIQSAQWPAPEYPTQPAPWGQGPTGAAWPQPQWQRPPVLPGSGTRYPQFWRAPGIKPFLPIVATLLMGVAFIATSTVAGLAGLLAGGMPSAEKLQELSQGKLTPHLVLANSVGIALVLACAFLIVRLIGQPPGYLSSVVGRFRWGFFWRCIGIAAVGFTIYTGLSILMDGVDSLGLEVHDYSWWLLIGLLLVTPFQAAAEEYLLRGFVFRTVGSWFAGPTLAAVVGGLVNSAIFASLHVSTDIWLNVVYFSMGAIASYLVWRTGGLEGAVAIHIVNNMIGMSLLAFQDMEAQFDRSAGVGSPLVLVQVLTFGLVAWGIVVAARRGSVDSTGPVSSHPA